MQPMAAQPQREFVRGLILAIATFIGIQLAKWAGANLQEWQRLAVEFVGGLIGYSLAAFVLGRFPMAKETP